MKKVLLFTAVAFLYVGMLQAQIVSSRSVSIKSEKQPSETMWYMRAGLNMAGLAGSDTEGLGKKAAYDITIGFEKMLSDMGLYWGMDYGLGSRGYKISESGYEESILNHNIQVSPFTFGWNYGILDNVKVDVHLGAFALYDFAGKGKVSYGGEEESYGISDYEGWQRFDAGLNAGFGIWYNRLNLDFTFQRGFVAAIEDAKAYTSNFMIRLGVAF